MDPSLAIRLTIFYGSEAGAMTKRKNKSKRRGKAKADAGPRVAADEEGEQEGTVVQELPNATFRVELGGGEVVLAQIAGKLRRPFCRIAQGDKVIVAVSPYDATRGRIVHRLK